MTFVLSGERRGVSPPVLTSLTGGLTPRRSPDRSTRIRALPTPRPGFLPPTRRARLASHTDRPQPANRDRAGSASTSAARARVAWPRSAGPAARRNSGPGKSASLGTRPPALPNPAAGTPPEATAHHGRLVPRQLAVW